MGAILAGAFEPDDIETMSLACEEVCNALHINGDARARETIAARVIELAQRGERRRTVLRDRVLAEANGVLVPMRLGVVACSQNYARRMSLPTAAWKTILRSEL